MSMVPYSIEKPMKQRIACFMGCAITPGEVCWLAYGVVLTTNRVNFLGLPLGSV